MFHKSRTFISQKIKCSTFPEHQKSLYGRGVSENLVFDIGLKCSEKIGTKILKKIKCTDFFGTRNVRIWRGIY